MPVVSELAATDNADEVVVCVVLAEVTDKLPVIASFPAVTTPVVVITPADETESLLTELTCRSNKLEAKDVGPFIVKAVVEVEVVFNDAPAEFSIPILYVVPVVFKLNVSPLTPRVIVLAP